jgi:hypothetical protein
VDIQLPNTFVDLPPGDVQSNTWPDTPGTENTNSDQQQDTARSEQDNSGSMQESPNFENVPTPEEMKVEIPVRKNPSLGEKIEELLASGDFDTSIPVVVHQPANPEGAEKAAEVARIEGEQDISEAEEEYLRERPDHREVFSQTTRDRKFFGFFFDGELAYNPNLIPHPIDANQYIVVAQHIRPGEFDVEQIVCNAGYMGGAMVCGAHPVPLEVAPGVIGNCVDDLAFANLASGPHDGRLFHGPAEPLFLYGSQSSYACFGQWLQDARMILEPYRFERSRVGFFKDVVEIRRPEPWRPIEKNFFIFWDANGVGYVHYDIFPTRTFSQLDFTGTAGPDLAPQAAGSDQRCMAAFMPHVRNSGREAIHQATNSLSITLCKRSDPGCIPTDSNTFVMHIFQHKAEYSYHSVYEPYVVLFRRTAPFQLHAISQRPIWIHGREQFTSKSDSYRYRGKDDLIPKGHTESFYVTSMSWKTHGQKYHGHIDDVLFLAFGIEDTKSGAIDVKAADLLQDLAFCELAFSSGP